MRFPRTDIIATGLVAVALVGYLGWLLVDDVPAPAAVRLMTGLVLALGFAASATAVVPSFVELVHGSRTYLVVASVLGIAATVAGALALINAGPTMLAILVIATVVMWALATTRHTRGHAAQRSTRPLRPRRHIPRHG